VPPHGAVGYMLGRRRDTAASAHRFLREGWTVIGLDIAAIDLAGAAAAR
jgi:hypothetical protein